MKKRVFLILLTVLVTEAALHAATLTSVKSGLWTDPTVWNPSQAPKNGDNIIIASTHTVTYNAVNINVNDLAIQANAVLQGDGTGQTLQVGKGGGEDVTNSGTLDLVGSHYAILLLNNDSQWNGTGVFALTSFNLNTHRLTFTSGAVVNVGLAGGGNPLSNFGKITGNTNVTFNFNGTTGQSISFPNEVIYGNLAINNPAGVTLTAALTSTSVPGDVRVQSGTLSNGGFSITGATGRTFQVVNGAEFDLTGTSGMVTGFTKSFGGASTVNYAGTNQTVSAESYGHLTLSGSGTKTMPGSSMTLSGNFTMSGTPSATAAQALTLWGNFTIGTGCTFNASSYTHTLKADFSNSGTFTASTSTITFNGNSAEAISGSSTTTFNNLTINNSSGITLATGSTVSTALTLTSGNITTGSNTLTLGSSSSALGTLTRTSGTIVGTFKRWFAAAMVSDVLFPVGTSSNYRPAKISFIAAPSAGGTLTVAFVASDPGGNGLPKDDGGFNVVNRGRQGYWTCTADGLTGGTYSLDLTADSFEGVSDYRTLRIMKRANSSSPWTFDGTHAEGTGSNQTPTACRTGLSGFSEFGIGGGPDNPLPIQLAGFSGRSIGANNVLLEWSTVSEVNNYGFYVQRRLENENAFRDLPTSFVAGHGTTLEPQHYSFTDAAAGDGVRFYRLRQVDLDGSVHYSEPIRVDLVTGVEEPSMPSEFALEQNYPNPFNPTTVIKYSLPASAHVSLKLYNLVGQEVLTLLDERQEAGVKSVTLNASGLPSGMYLYKLHAGDFVSTKRLVLLK